MKRSSVVRRLLAVTTSVFIGLVGALALASPASAHHPIVDGYAECDSATGEWIIDWTVKSSDDAETYELTSFDVEVSPDSATELSLPLNVPKSISDSFTGQHRVPGSTESVKLAVHAKWNNGNESDGSKTITLGRDGEDCAKAVEWGSIVSCDFLVVFVRNNAERGDATLALTPNQDATHGHAPDFLPLIDEIDENGFVEVPEEAGLQIVGPIGAGETVGPLGPFPPGAEHAHGFEAFAGLKAQVMITLDGQTVVNKTVSWDKLTADLDCGDGGQGGGDDDEGLPVTGTSTGIIAGVAVALLALGGGLYLFTRRRRINFTA